jgi:hypothetical protein
MTKSYVIAFLAIFALVFAGNVQGGKVCLTQDYCMECPGTCSAIRQGPNSWQWPPSGPCQCIGYDAGSGLNCSDEKCKIVSEN